MVDCYVIRFYFNTNTQIIHPLCTLNSFPSDHNDYSSIYGILPCIYSELFSVRLQIKNYLEQILFSQASFQGSGDACLQKRQYQSFGKMRWTMFLLLLKVIGKGNHPIVVGCPRQKIYRYVKPNLSQATKRKKVNQEKVTFLYPDHFQLSK